MKLLPTPLEGVLVVEPEQHHDERGFFARTYCAEDLGFRVAQASTSFNTRAFTLRGMHWQAEPGGETKLVRCTRGRVYDVALDLRPGSPTRLGWFAVELDPLDSRGLLIPAGCAHGFLTLEDATEVSYLIDHPHVAGLARGARWDDPAFAIEWPAPPTVLSERDATWPPWEAP